MTLKTIIFSFLSGLISSMGFGGGTVLIMYLTVIESFPQTKAQGINLLFFIPCAIFAVISYIKQGLIQKEKLRGLIFPAILGAVAGFMLIEYIPTEILRKFFGGFILILGILQLFDSINKKISKKNKKNSKKG